MGAGVKWWSPGLKQQRVTKSNDNGNTRLHALQRRPLRRRQLTETDAATWRRGAACDSGDNSQ